MKEIVLQVIPGSFSICKVTDPLKMRISRGFCFVACTDEENSMVIPTETVPQDAEHRSDGWRGFRIRGELDFSLVGIIADITRILAKHQIPVFAVSTYNTDYFFVQSDRLQGTMQALFAEGYALEE